MERHLQQHDWSVSRTEGACLLNVHSYINSRDVLCQCAQGTRGKGEPAREDESPLPRAIWWQWRSVVSPSHRSSPSCRTRPLQGRNSQCQGKPSLLLMLYFCDPTALGMWQGTQFSFETDEFGDFTKEGPNFTQGSWNLQGSLMSRTTG